MIQLSKFFIHFWLAFTIASFIWAIYRIVQSGWNEGAVNLYIPVIAFFWWLTRRAMHRRMEKHQQNQQNR